jgi:hypothetical protein
MPSLAGRSAEQISTPPKHDATTPTICDRQASVLAASALRLVAIDLAMSLMQCPNLVGSELQLLFAVRERRNLGGTAPGQTQLLEPVEDLPAAQRFGGEIFRREALKARSLRRMRKRF